VWVDGAGHQSRLTPLPRFHDGDLGADVGGPTAPMPGTVVAVEVEAGQEVSAGTVLIVLEAMKMQHRVVAAQDGVVEVVLVAPGDSVEAHQLLVTFAGG
jgi:biotin carboxyl carrier protein